MGRGGDGDRGSPRPGVLSWGPSGGLHRDGSTEGAAGAATYTILLRCLPPSLAMLHSARLSVSASLGGTAPSSSLAFLNHSRGCGRDQPAGQPASQPPHTTAAGGLGLGSGSGSGVGVFLLTSLLPDTPATHWGLAGPSGLSLLWGQVLASLPPPPPPPPLPPPPPPWPGPAWGAVQGGPGYLLGARLLNCGECKVAVQAWGGCGGQPEGSRGAAAAMTQSVCSAGGRPPAPSAAWRVGGCAAAAWCAQ